MRSKLVETLREWDERNFNEGRLEGERKGLLEGQRRGLCSLASRRFGAATGTELAGVVAGAWHGTVDVACGLTAASAPEEANASLQIVNVTGTLSSCAPYALTASSRCQFFCKGPSGSVPC